MADAQLAIILDVVPANAGTHNPGHLLWTQASATIPNREVTAYGVPAFAETTT
jgi:hypothetical protein